MFVEELSNAGEWEDFVQSVPTGTFYHSLKWKEVIQKSFPHRAAYLVVREANGKVVGVSPGFITETFHTRIYDSTPYSDYGGPVIETPHISKASLAILDFIRDLSSSESLAYSRFRVTEKGLANCLSLQTEFAESNTVGVMEINLTTTPSRFIWSNLFSYARQKKFKLMERRGFQVREARTRSDLGVFYNLYLKNIIHLGARPYPYSFMESIWDTLFPSYVRIWIVEKEKPLAALLAFRFAQKSFAAYAGIERDLQPVHLRPPVSFMYYLEWMEIKKAEEEGLCGVSLGSTPSDPCNRYFLQKSSMGCVFYPQAIILNPLCSSGRILVKMRGTGVRMWKGVRSYLPRPLTRILESKLDRL